MPTSCAPTWQATIDTQSCIRNWWSDRLSHARGSAGHSRGPDFEIRRRAGDTRRWTSPRWYRGSGETQFTIRDSRIVNSNSQIEIRSTIVRITRDQQELPAKLPQILGYRRGKSTSKALTGKRNETALFGVSEPIMPSATKRPTNSRAVRSFSPVIGTASPRAIGWPAPAWQRKIAGRSRP